MDPDQPTNFQPSPIQESVTAVLTLGDFPGDIPERPCVEKPSQVRSYGDDD